MQQVYLWEEGEERSLQELREPGIDLVPPFSKEGEAIWLLPDEVHCEERGMGE